MNGLCNRAARSKAKLRGAEAVIEVGCQSFLKERSINFIHGVSKGDRAIVRKELCVFLVILNQHDHFGV